MTRAHAVGLGVRIGMAYGLASGLLLAIAWLGAGWWLLAIWPALACALVGIDYLTGSSAWVALRPGWALPIRWLLLAPWLWATHVNAWVWTHQQPAAVPVAEGIWLGKALSRSGCQRLGMRSVVSMAAERACPTGIVPCQHIPVLDLTVPSSAQIQQAVDAIDQARIARPTLVCCALGYSRSALAVAAWLVATGAVPHPDAAIARLRQGPRRVVLSPTHRRALWLWHSTRSTP